jgi:two-component system capsular synthesis response regulator RcsB
MNLQQKTGPSAKTPWRQSACDDTPVSRGHRGTPPLRIVIADDHPVVLMGAEVALSSPGSTYSIIAQAHNADELIGHLEHTPYRHQCSALRLGSEPVHDLDRKTAKTV